MTSVTGKVSGSSAAGVGRTPVDNVVAKWMGQHGIRVTKNGVYAQPNNDENASPVSDADANTPGLDAHFWAYQGMASAELQQVSQALFDLTEIITADRRQMSDWMSKIEGGLEKLRDRIDTQATSNGTSVAASSKHIEYLVQDEFSKQQLWLTDRFRRLGLRLAQETQEQGNVKPAANPEAKPDSKPSSNRDSKQSIPEVLKRAMNVHHSSKARQPEQEKVEESSSTAAAGYARSVAPRMDFATPTTVGSGGMFKRDLGSEREKTAQYLAKMKKMHQDRSTAEMMLRFFGMDRDSIKDFKRKPRNFMTMIVDSTLFNTISMLTVVTNGVWMGWQISKLMQDVLDGNGRTRYGTEVNLFFTIVYSLELAIKLCAYRAFFFWGGDLYWNMYDCLVVIAGILDKIFEIADLSMSMLRAARVLRMIRVARLFRIFRSFEGIRYLLCSMTASATLIFWTVVFLAFVIYIFAVLLMQGFIMADRFDTADPYVKEMTARYYGTVPKTMLTLCMAISGGQPWESLVSPLWEASPVLLHAFVYFVTITLYGILNVVNGVFVCQAATNRQHDRDLAVQQEMVDSDMFRKQLRSILSEKGLCGDDDISLHLLKDILADFDLQMFLQTHGIDSSEAGELCLLLDVDQDGIIPVDDFVFGCLRMKGLAKGMDIVLLSDQVSQLRTDLTHVSDKQRELSRVLRITKEKLSAELEETTTLASDIFEEVRDLTKAERLLEDETVMLEAR